MKSTKRISLSHGERSGTPHEPLPLRDDLRAAVERIGGVAAASAASVMAQMVRTPVPAAPLSARTLEADDATSLPQLSGAFPVVAHRAVIGDLKGDLLVAQSAEMVRWTGANLPALGAADAVWAARRLADLAGIALAAFALALGRAVDLRIKPEWLPGPVSHSVAALLSGAVEAHDVVLALEAARPDGRSVGDFFLVSDVSSLEALLAAIEERL
ncbi:MAG: hypothetical protein OEM67_05590 [Thermoleophilia bacterium]|nr:hypothetical protein [Thermoleophilia bacterium]